MTIVIQPHTYTKKLKAMLNTKQHNCNEWDNSLKDDCGRVVSQPTNSSMARLWILPWPLPSSSKLCAIWLLLWSKISLIFGYQWNMPEI